jgi:hypothetical protein
MTGRSCTTYKYISGKTLNDIYYRHQVDTRNGENHHPHLSGSADSLTVPGVRR